MNLGLMCSTLASGIVRRRYRLVRSVVDRKSRLMLDLALLEERPGRVSSSGTIPGLSE